MSLLEKYGLRERFNLEAKEDLLGILEDPTYWVSLWNVIGCSCGGYNGDLDELLLGLVNNYIEKGDNNGIFFDKTRQNEIELLNYIMCSSDILDYGTSPRFPWLTPYGEVVFKLYFEQERPDWLDKEDL